MSETFEDQSRAGPQFFNSDSLKKKNRSMSTFFSERVLLDIVALSEIIVAFFSAYAVKHVYFYYFLNQSGDDRHYLLLVLVSCTILYFGLKRAGLYEPKSLFQPFVPIASLLFAVIATAAVTLGVLFILKETDYYSRGWFIGWFATLFALLVASRVFWSNYIQSLSDRGFFSQNIVLIGAGSGLTEARKRLEAESPRKQAVTTIDLTGLRARDLEENPGPEHEAAIEALIRDAQRHRIDKVVVALPSEQNNLLHYLTRRLRLLPIEVTLMPYFGDLSVPIQSVQDESGLQVLRIQKKPISDWGVGLKMVEDYVLGALLVLTFLPAMAVIALAIKLDSRGPVLFRQRRHGFNHQIIQVLKFRTMTVLEDGDSVQQATQNDRRVTRLGRFLRRTSLDELPQLFNVLKGDMSLVGPRPHALAHNDHFSKLLDNYATRHRVKPGLTGWAQVNGFRGETPNGELMQARVDYDIEYIDNWSIWFDLKIIALTPIYGFISRRAY